MIERIDQWLIDKVFQRIVDWSQREGGWWIRELAFFCAIYSVIRIVAQVLGYTPDARSIVGISIDFLCALMFCWWARDKVRVANLGTATSWRRFFIVFSFISLPLDLWRYPFNLPCDIAFIGFYFFAACRPPKPREKKETKPKLAFNN
jgi:hypothetical protein